ncbi:retrovirus-related pol polyprotein from transposon TNT 1-94 [Tanacetum coccineum]
MFADLIQQHDPDEDISQDHLREEELRLCLEDEEMLRCEHEKLIIEENRLRLDEANRLRLEEENMLQLEEQKKNKRKEFMNSSYGKNILAKLAPAKRNQLGSSSEKINSKVSWVKIKKDRQYVNDPCTAKLLKNVKPWVEDILRVLHCMDTVWLSDDIERFLGQPGQVKCKFLWNDDYTVDRNFWFKLVCLDTTRKGWLTKELSKVDQEVSYQKLGFGFVNSWFRITKEVSYHSFDNRRFRKRFRKRFRITSLSNSTNSNQQTLADSGANERPPMLEKGNYIPWESRFRRFLDNKLEDGERMWNSIQNGPYQRPMVVDPINPTVPILEPLSKMTEGNKKQYIADVRVMNYLLQAIPNDIYNSVDACKNAKEMWERIKRLMHGSEITTHVRHSRLMDEFDKFAAKEGESLDSVHERLTTLVNIMDRNNVRPIPVAINTKFLNCLQPEWSKYVTMVRHNQTGPAVSYDVLYDQLVQFEPHVLASRAKKAAKNHDPLALIAHSNASSSHSHANSSYSPQPYYVTHPPSVVDYDDEYQGELQGDSQEDKLTTAMMLLARVISQKFSTPTNNRLRVSSNTRNQVMVHDGLVDIQTKNAGYGGKANNNVGRNITQGFNAVKLSTLHDENVLLKHQVESTIKERENIKLEFQKLFNSIKATRAQHQNEINEMFEDVTQKTYAYADVRAQNQDLLMTISELKSKLKTIDKGKHVNTKFDKSETLGQLLCVTPFNKNIAIKAKNVSNTKVTSDRSKPVTSQSTPTIEQKQQHNTNVIARGMYKINQEDTKTKDSKANTNVSNSTGNSNKSKNNVLKNTKSSSTYVLKTTSSVYLDSNKCETKPLNVCQTNACRTSSKTINAINDGLNMLCISCGLDVFLHSHEKCVARNALTRKSSVKRALFTFPVTAKSKGLGATSVVAKSRFNVAKTPTTTTKILDSGCSKHMTGNFQLLRTFVEKFMGIVRFGNDHFVAITGYGDYVQGNLTICHVYYVEGLGHNLFSVGKFYDEDLEVAFRSNTYGGFFSSVLMSRATSTKSWLWLRRLSHLNFNTINELTSHDLVDGLPKFKYHKNHLCSAYEQGKSKKTLLPPKLVPSTESKLELLHMDLCGPMRVASINGKKYILVIVDDYSWYTWVYFLRTKDEAPDMITDFVNQVQRNLKALILTIQTDNGTEFKNEKLNVFYATLGIVHKTSIARTP